MKKAALITGGAKRIGAELALFLAKKGYDIAIAYNRSKEDAQKIGREIAKHGSRCEIFKSDFSKVEEASRLVPKVFKKFPHISLLINNASVFERSLISDTTLELLDRAISINFKTPFILSRDFARLCQTGNIINILDARITSNRSTYAAYSLSKKALAELTRMAAVEFAPKIRVNGIAPGLILPPAGKNKRYLEKLALNIPLQKKGSVENIKSALQFLLENDYVTGQIIFCDGGEHLQRLHFGGSVPNLA